MPFNLQPAQPAPQIFMDQSTFSQNLRTPQSDSSTDFAPQDNIDGSPQAHIKIPYANDLSQEEFEIVKQVEVLAFDQAGCRMIQKKLEENQHQLTGPDFFVRSLLLTMLDILPQVMTN